MNNPNYIYKLNYRHFVKDQNEITIEKFKILNKSGHYILIDDGNFTRVNTESSHYNDLSVIFNLLEPYKRIDVYGYFEHKPTDQDIQNAKSFILEKIDLEIDKLTKIKKDIILNFKQDDPGN